MSYLDKFEEIKAQQARKPNSRTLNQNKYAFYRAEVVRFCESMSRNIPLVAFSALFGSEDNEAY